MFCSKCGKELRTGDKFCSNCGAAVAAYKEDETVVFNPPFKIEADKTTEEILKSLEKPEKKVDHISVNWDLRGLNLGEPKKTKDVDFHWETVVEKKKEERAGIEPSLGFKSSENNAFFTDKDAVTKATQEIEAGKINEAQKLHKEKVEKIPNFQYIEPKRDQEPVKEAPTFNELLDIALQVNSETALSREELEREIFSDMGTLPKEKSEEEKADETEKLDDLFTSLKPINENVPEIVEEVKSENTTEATIVNTPTEEIKSETETAVVEPETIEPVAEAKDVEEILQEVKPKETPVKDDRFYTYHAKVDAFDELLKNVKPADYNEAEEKYKDESAKAKKQDAKKEEPVKESTKEETKTPKNEANPSKEKLRYSDVFPRGVVDSNKSGNNDGDKKNKGDKKAAKGQVDSEMDLYQTKPKKKHVLLKIIIALLIILLVLEALLLLVRTVAPESTISTAFSSFVEKLTTLVKGTSN